MDYYYKKKDGSIWDLSKFANIVREKKEIIEVKLPHHKELFVNLNDNLLTKLEVPNTCYWLTVRKNKLTSLVLPGSIKHAEVDGNQLTSLTIEEGCEKVLCHKNKLTSLKIPESCTYLWCNNNKLTELIVPKGMQHLVCKGNKIKEITVLDGCYVDADPDTKINIIKLGDLDFGKINKENVISKLILKIKNVVLWTIADIITKSINVTTKEEKIPIKEIKKIEKTNPKLTQMFSKAEGKEILQKHSNGFSINDLEYLDLTTQGTLLQNKFIEVGHSKWFGKQRHFRNTDNHVFLINLKPFKSKEILDASPNAKAILDFMKNTPHPIDKELISLAWVRFVYLEDRNAIAIEEVQSDFDKPEMLGPELLKDWAEFTLKLFIQYVRKKYKIRKIYLVTYEYRISAAYYSIMGTDGDARPPMYIYKDVANKFGFSKKSDLEGFMVLEQFELPKFEQFILL